MQFEITGSRETRRVQRSLLNKWILPYTDLSPEELLNFWSDSKLSSASVRKLLSIYRKWYKFTFGQELEIKTNHQQNAQKKVKAWSEEEVITLLNYCSNNNKYLHEILTVLFSTAMRRGELFGLQPDDIDFTRNQINIMRSYGSETTKTGRCRTIPMTPAVKNIMKKRIKDIYLFKYDPHLTEKIKKVCHKAGVRVLTAHAARHSAASMALESGMSPREVAALLGHGSVAVTLGIYWSNVNPKISLDFLPESLAF